MTPLNLQTRKRSGKAFTLIEVAIALGLASFALLTIIALLGQAITGAGEAAGETIGAEVGGRLMGELQLMDWKTLTTETPQMRYFDEFGEELTQGDAANSCVFSARQVVFEPDISMATSGGAAANPHGVKVSVVVADLPGKAGQDLIAAYINSKKTSRKLHIFQSVVVNMEKPEAE